MPNIKHRSVTPIISALRDFGRGKKFVVGLRYADQISKRTQPDPNIPGGIYHKSSKVYYYTRDARRLVQPPIELFSQEQLESGQVELKKLSSTTPIKKIEPK